MTNRHHAFPRYLTLGLVSLLPLGCGSDTGSADKEADVAELAQAVTLAPPVMTEFRVGVVGPTLTLPKDPVAILAQGAEPQIALKALAPKTGGSPLYVYRKERGLLGELLTRVRVAGPSAATKPASSGFMVRESEHPKAGYSMAGVTSNGKVFVEIGLPDRPKQRWEAPLHAQQTEVALRLRSDGRSLQYFASTVDGAKRDVWIPIGAPFFAAADATIGMYLDPGASAAFTPPTASATFTSFSVRELRSGSSTIRPALAKTSAAAAIPGVPFDLFRGPLPGPNYSWPIRSGPTVPFPVPPIAPQVPFGTLRPAPQDIPLPVLDTCQAFPFISQACARTAAQPDLPEGTPSRIIDRLKASYPVGSHGRNFNGDPIVNELYGRVGELKRRPLLSLPANISPAEELRISSYNAETYLADVVRSKVSADPLTNDPTKVWVPLTSNFPFMAPVRQLRRTIEFCNDAVDISWYELLSFTFVADAIDCVDEVKKATKAIDAVSKDLPDADKATLNAAEYLQTLGLLSLIDPNFLGYTESYTFQIKNQITGKVEDVTVTSKPNLALVRRLAGEVDDWVDVIHQVMNDGNIPLKAQAGLATVGLAFRDGRGLRALQPMIAKDFTSNGGFGEGTGYLRYVNQQLLPLYTAAKLSGRLPDGVMPDSFVRSGQWLLNLSDPSGFIPAIDDSRVPLIQDTDAGRDGYLAPFTVLTGDPRFKAFVQGGRFHTTGLVCLTPDGSNPAVCPDKVIPTPSNGTNGSVASLLSYPIDVSSDQVAFNERVVTDGAAKLTTLQGDTTTSLTLLAENGQLLSAGSAHDQQDGLNVTLNRARAGQGKIAVDQLIADGGYGGFSVRAKTAGFLTHNVPYLLDDGGVAPNAVFTGDELMTQVLSVFPEAYGAGRDSNWWHANFGQGVFALATYLLPKFYDLSGKQITKGAGGGSSSVVGHSANSATARLDYDTGAGEYALRTTFWDGGDHVIVDSIHSSRGTYGVRYALPSQAQPVDKGFGVKLPGDGVAGGSSRLMMHVRSQTPDTDNKQLRATSFSTDLKELVVENRSAGKNHSFFSFLTVAQALDGGEEPRGYEPCTEANAAICLKTKVPGGTRLVFVNLRDDSRTWTMRLPSPAGASSDLFTDASYGTVTFDEQGAVSRARLFNVTKAYITNGTSSVAYPSLQSEVSLGALLTDEAVLRSAPFFDAAAYASYYPKLASALGGNANTAARDWVESGIDDGRTSSPVFDARFYLAQNADLRTAFGARNFRAAAYHWLRSGRAEGRAASAVFDARFYVQKYSDLAAAFGTDYAAAANHFLQFGIAEGRQASATFSSVRYLALNPDVATFCGNNYGCAVQHYLTFGRYEGREANDRQALDGGGSYNACRGQGNYVCTELVQAFPNYYVNRPSCLRNPGCDGQYYSCSPLCSEPNDADR